MALAKSHLAEDGLRGQIAALMGSYTVRIELALVLSLLLVGLSVHLPWEVPLRVIGWQIRTDVQRTAFDLMDLQEVPQEEGGGAPVSQFTPAVEDPTEPDDEPGEPETAPAEQEALPTPPPIKKLAVRQAALDFAEKQPEIVGGLGAYYIHIAYPEKAVERNIQGRLILTFVVEPDGSTSEVTVLKSLHPLCDSAAVQALRKTHFVPGYQNGEAVRVRMRLPVQFKIVDPAPADSAGTVPSATEPTPQASID